VRPRATTFYFTEAKDRRAISVRDCDGEPVAERRLSAGHSVRNALSSTRLLKKNRHRTRGASWRINGWHQTWRSGQRLSTGSLLSEYLQASDLLPRLQSAYGILQRPNCCVYSRIFILYRCSSPWNHTARSFRPERRLSLRRPRHSRWATPAYQQLKFRFFWKIKMADGRHLEKSKKIVISQQLFGQSGWNLTQWRITDPPNRVSSLTLQCPPWKICPCDAAFCRTS